MEEETKRSSKDLTNGTKLKIPLFFNGSSSDGKIVLKQRLKISVKEPPLLSPKPHTYRLKIETESMSEVVTLKPTQRTEET